MKTSRAESLLLFFCIFGAVATALALFFFKNNESSSDNSGRAGIGVVRPDGGDVRRRNSNDADWGAINKQVKVHNEDHIFTGKSSTARVTLNSKQEFLVNANSLVVVRNRRNEIRVNLDQGGFLGVLKKGVRLVVEKNNVVNVFEAQSENSTIRIESGSKENHDIKLVVLKGELLLKDEARQASQLIEQNTEVVIENRGSEETPKLTIVDYKIDILRPEPASLVWMQSDTVHFSWVADLKEGSPEKPEMTILLAKDSEMKEIVQQTSTRSNNLIFKIKEAGNYFWQIRSVKNPQVKSPVSMFTLVQLRPPELLEFRAQYQLSSESSTELEKPIQLNWTDPSFSDNFEVLISESQDFTKPVLKLKTQQFQTQIEELAKGHYFVQVVGTRAGRPNLKSQVKELTVKEAPPNPKQVEEPQRILSSVTVPAAAGPVEEPEIAVEYLEVREAKPVAVEAPKTVVVQKAVEEPKVLELPPQKIELKKVVKVKQEPPKAEVVKDSPKESEIPQALLPSPPIVAAQEVLSPVKERPKFWLWGGLGISIVISSQDTDSYTKGKAASIASPQFSFRAGGYLNEKNGLDFSYKQTPGYLINTSSGSDIKEIFFWKNLAIEYLSVSDRRISFYSYPSVLTYRWGLQDHTMFTLVPIAPGTAPISILSTSVTTFSAGVGLETFTRNNSLFEFNFRYQHPFSGRTASAFDSYKVTPVFSLDGSIAYIYLPAQNWRIGSYWFGQYHTYNFTYDRSGNVYKGQQNFFNSTMELRLGYEF